MVGFPVIQALQVAEMEHIVLPLRVKRGGLGDQLFADLAGDFLLIFLFGHGRLFLQLNSMGSALYGIFYSKEKPVFSSGLLVWESDQGVTALEFLSSKLEDPFGRAYF